MIEGIPDINASPGSVFNQIDLKYGVVVRLVIVASYCFYCLMETVLSPPPSFCPLSPSVPPPPLHKERWEKERDPLGFCTLDLNRFTEPESTAAALSTLADISGRHY